MAFLTGTKAQMRVVREALSRAEGLPRRGVVYLNGVPDSELTERIIPATFTPGALGWTEHACAEPDESDDSDEAALEVPTELERHLQQADRAQLKSESQLPAKLRAKREARKVERVVEPRDERPVPRTPRV